MRYIIRNIGLVFAGIVLFLVLIFAFWAVTKSFNRYQKRADANNNVKVTEIQIHNQEQRVQIAKQKAQIRYQEALGIRKAQDAIAATLTPLYVQHEAIEAQVEMAQSDNHSVIWAPTGANGVPLVSTLDVQRFGQEGK